MSFVIQGLGTALPPHGMSQVEAVQMAQRICCDNEEQSRLLGVLYRRSGVDQRYTVLPHRIALEMLPEPTVAANAHANGYQSTVLPPADEASGTSASGAGPTTAERMTFYAEHALPLAEQAARTALAEAEYAPGEITHLITVSCTGFSAPGVDVELIRALGLRPTTERVHVGFMGCHGALNGLRVARAIAAADPAARILLCAVELCSLHYRFAWDPEKFIGNILFSDGAAALVGTSANELSAGGQVAATGSCLVPDSTDAMTWRVGNHGFEMSLSARVPDLIREHLRPWLGEWLARHHLRVEDIASWAIHPGGPRILSAVEESLSLPSGATKISREVLASCGNMSSPTVLFIYDRQRRLPQPHPCVMLGFGPGLVAEAVLLK